MFFGFEVLPEAEQSSAWLIHDAVVHIDRNVREFHDALALVEFTEQERTKPSLSAEQSMRLGMGWPLLAARDAAMTIYHIHVAVTGIWETRYGCPTFWGMADESALRKAGKVLSSQFPNLLKLRDCIAHVNDRTRTLKKHADHAFSGIIDQPGFNSLGSQLTAFFLSGRRLVVTWNGEELAYDLTNESLDRLKEVRDLARKALEPASVETMRMFKVKYSGSYPHG